MVYSKPALFCYYLFQCNVFVLLPFFVGLKRKRSDQQPPAKARKIQLIIAGNGYSTQQPNQQRSIDPHTHIHPFILIHPHSAIRRPI